MQRHGRKSLRLCKEQPRKAEDKEMNENEGTTKEDLTELPGFPQEIAWAVSALTYLTSDEQWPAFFAYLDRDGNIDAGADPNELREIAGWAASKLHSIGHTMVERRRAMMELPPFLRQMMGVPADDDEDEPENEAPDAGNYL
jgi:hypothetical protein